MGVNRLFENIEEGRKGRNIGISTGLPMIDSLIYGIQRKYLYTIGADTSGGKTSFAIDVFVYNLLKNAGNTPVSILYYSFEMSSDILFAKILSLYIFDTYGQVISYQEILSLDFNIEWSLGDIITIRIGDKMSILTDVELHRIPHNDDQYVIKNLLFKFMMMNPNKEFNIKQISEVCSTHVQHQ